MNVNHYKVIGGMLEKKSNIMKSLILIFWLLFFNHMLYSQIPTGNWRIHPLSHKTIDLAYGNGVIYNAFENAILEYDVATGDKSTWTSVNALSDVSITCVLFDTYSQGLFVGYENGNIDYIKNNKVTNIPAIVLSNVSGLKKVNNFNAYDQKVYCSTGFGIVVIDPIKLEVSDTYYPTSNSTSIIDVDFANDSIYALTNTTLLKAKLSNPTLADYGQWSQEPNLPSLSSTSIYKDIVFLNDELYVLQQDPAYASDSVFCVKGTGLEYVSQNSFNLEIYSISTFNDQIVVNVDGGTLLYQKIIDGLYSQTNFYPMSGSGVVKSHFIDENEVWAGNHYKGLIHFKNGGQTNISIAGPPKDEFYRMAYNDGKIVVVGGGLDSKFMTYSHSGVYVFDSEAWTLIDEYNMDLWEGQQIWDYVSVAINPRNQEEIAVGTYSPVPLSLIKNNEVTEIFSGDNSEIEVNATSNATLISNLQYDKDDNIWMTNCFSSYPLKVYTSDENWYKYTVSSSIMDKVINRFIIDNNGYKWMSASGAGIVVYDDKSTLTDASDDEVKVINNGTNTGALPSNDVNAIVIDLDGDLWIGTESGFAILYNASNIFNAQAGEYNVQRIKLEFEGNVEYLLGNTNITDIEVDGGNRKWLGTANAGLFLLSADGTEIIQSFTAEDSPLLSNTIIDLQLNHQTGELFIITDKGLISYRSDASEGYANYSNVKIFPNPVQPNFAGLITIQGIQYDSDVKITDVAGNLVYKTTSNGGTATWNGKTLDGQRVSTGVYLIWTAPNDGKGRKVGKVVVIN